MRTIISDTTTRLQSGVARSVRSMGVSLVAGVSDLTEAIAKTR